MSVPALLNLLRFFHNKCDTFNNTEAQLLGYVYHYINH